MDRENLNVENVPWKYYHILFSKLFNQFKIRSISLRNFVENEK